MKVIDRNKQKTIALLECIKKKTHCGSVHIGFKHFKARWIQSYWWTQSVMGTRSGFGHLYPQKMLYLPNLFPFGLFMRVMREASLTPNKCLCCEPSVWHHNPWPKKKRKREGEREGRMRRERYKRDEDGWAKTQSGDSEGWVRRRRWRSVGDIRHHQTLYSWGLTSRELGLEY